MSWPGTLPTGPKFFHELIDSVYNLIPSEPILNKRRSEGEIAEVELHALIWNRGFVLIVSVCFCLINAPVPGRSYKSPSPKRPVHHIATQQQHDAEHEIAEAVGAQQSREPVADPHAQ